MKKSEIAGVDFATEEMIATDNIRLDGQVFHAIDANQAHKVLGVRISLTGDFTAEKQHVLTTMQVRLQALREDRMLTPILKELAIKIGVVPIFRYSAGVVPWSKTELERINTMWLAANNVLFILLQSMCTLVPVARNQSAHVLVTSCVSFALAQ